MLRLETPDKRTNAASVLTILLHAATANFVGVIAEYGLNANDARPFLLCFEATISLATASKLMGHRTRVRQARRPQNSILKRNLKKS